MDFKEINKEQLEKLSPEERKIALEILEQYASKGSSNLFNELVYSDYEEIPVDIDTFIDDENYLRYAWYDSEGKCKLFPFWRDKLHNIFPNNIDTNFNDMIFSGARGLGKSEIAVLVAAYLMYRIMCLKNPLEYYHMKPTEKFCFAFMNITQKLAEEIANSKFQNTVKYSPWFIKHGTFSGRNNQYWNPPSYIEIIIGSQSSDVIGKPILFGFFDEINFIRNQDIEVQKKKAIDMIDTAIGGMLTRFVHNGKNPTVLILGSSKRSEKSFLETHMKKKLEENSAKSLIVDEAVWNVHPDGTYSKKTFPVAVGNKFLVSQVVKKEDDIEILKSKGYRIIDVPIDFKSNFFEDIDRALCDFAGISSTELSKYISGVAVYNCVDTSFSNPFVKDIIEVGNGKEDTQEYKNFFDLNRVPKNMMGKPLFIHLDMSISGDMTGIAGVWICGKKTSSDESLGRDLMFQLAFSVSVKAPKGRQISFEKNRNFVRWLREVGFSIKKVTSDTFQSYDLQQQLKMEGFDCEILSVDRVDKDHICKPYQYFKNAIYEQRFKMYKSQELIDELTDLERNINTGKVDHPVNGKKDVSDATCGATFTASKYAEEYAYDYGEDYDVTLAMNNADVPVVQETAKKQMIIDFENELKNLNPLKDVFSGNTNTSGDSDDYSYISGDTIIW